MIKIQILLKIIIKYGYFNLNIKIMYIINLILPLIGIFIWMFLYSEDIIYNANLIDLFLMIDEVLK